MENDVAEEGVAEVALADRRAALLPLKRAKERGYKSKFIIGRVGESKVAEQGVAEEALADGRTALLPLTNAMTGGWTRKTRVSNE